MFGTQSQVTECLARTICPTWDQTLIFENVQIYGSIDKVARNPPEVIIELFDKDPVVRNTCSYYLRGTQPQFSEEYLFGRRFEI